MINYKQLNTKDTSVSRYQLKKCNDIMKIKMNKIAIVGCGDVGSTTAFSLLMSNVVSELVLFDINKEKVMGEKLDMEHALPFLNNVKISATDKIEDLKGVDIIIYAAGFAQKPGESRLDLTSKNLKIVDELIPQINMVVPNAIILMITNPVDVLTQRVFQLIPGAAGRVFGSGTTLDTARFKYHIAEKINVDPKSIHAYILGEHGESAFPVYENSLVGGQKLLDFPGVTQEIVDQAFKDTRQAAAKIIVCKGSTYYGIAVAATEIVKAIVGNTQTILPVSIPMLDYYGFSGVSLSLPCVIGKNGVERVIMPELSSRETEDLRRSVGALKKYI